MPEFIATVRVVHIETWSVDAADKAEARKKLEDLHADVQDDESGGEVVDWQIEELKESH